MRIENIKKGAAVKYHSHKTRILDNWDGFYSEIRFCQGGASGAVLTHIFEWESILVYDKWESVARSSFLRQALSK